ncbi:MAG: DNA gyrase inhibitor YacG [Planctomycetota bacterium]
MVRPTTCPICESAVSASAATESSFFPFCSERCRNVDLLRWSDGKYAIVEPLSSDQMVEHIGDDPEAIEELLGGQ